MVRTQILLEPDQYEFLKERSKETGESLSALIREAVDQLRDDTVPLRQRAKELLGAFKADRDDVSLRHDEYFAEQAARR